MTMKVVLLFLALCGLATAQTLDECIATIDATHAAFMGLPDHCVDVTPPANVAETVEFCDECMGGLCLSLTGDSADDCRLVFLESCLFYGEYVSECFNDAVVDRCIAAVDTDNAAVQALPESCSVADTDPTDADNCRDCIGAECSALTGARAEGCRDLVYEICSYDAGVNVSECDRGDELLLFEECLATIEEEENDPASCSFGMISSPADNCRNCAAAQCLAFRGDRTDECRAFVYETCDSFGVKITECGALALVTIKGVLAVVLVLAAFFVF